MRASARAPASRACAYYRGAPARPAHFFSRCLPRGGTGRLVGKAVRSARNARTRELDHNRPRVCREGDVFRPAFGSRCSLVTLTLTLALILALAPNLDLTSPHGRLHCPFECEKESSDINKRFSALSVKCVCSLLYTSVIRLYCCKKKITIVFV